MELIFQPRDGALGDNLIETLYSGIYTEFNVVVAFAKLSGVKRLEEALCSFREEGGRVRICVGIDLYGTSYEALVKLYEVSDLLIVFHNEGNLTFHPKIYEFGNGKIIETYVGSNNLTSGGLWTNYEASVRYQVTTELIQDLDRNSTAKGILDGLSESPEFAMKITQRRQLDKLLECGYVEKESSSVIRFNVSQRQKPKASKANLFGSSSAPNVPQITPIGTRAGDVMKRTLNKKPQPRLLEPAGGHQTLWLETRKMTGGSRNILDLSMSSLLLKGQVKNTRYEHQDDKYMKGAVEFFDIDPTDTSFEKEVTLLYGQKEYVGNIIKFPSGARSNRTWRLQINGVAADGEKITAAFPEVSIGQYYLPNKVVLFKKISSSYYVLTVHDKSDLEKIKQASSIIAHNGRTNSAKLLGLI